MTELLRSTGPGGLALAALAGAALGLLHFAGLWWTVERLARGRGRVGLLLASALVRLAVVAGGLFLIMQGSWTRALAALAGLLLARALVLRRLTHADAGRAPDAAHS